MKALLPFLFCLFFNLVAAAQSYSDIANLKSGMIGEETSSIIGLWEVESVMVGDQERTPTAKWFSFLANGTTTSGNGGVQNGEGTYNYDQDKDQLWTALEGEADSYGPFKVELDGLSMNWSRIEDGMKVTVLLKKVDKKPLAPWDLIIGNWTIQKAEGYNLESGKLQSEYLLEPDRYFFRWDRRYEKYDLNGNKTETGIWHIEAHSMWLWTISDQDNIKTGYSLSLENDQMTWTKDGEQEKLKISLIKND